MKSKFILFIVCIGLLHYVKAQSNFPNDRSILDTSIAPFYHGVASGDPLPDKVIIWTRVTSTDATVAVKWKVATDSSMHNIIKSGQLTTSALKDYTVKIDVTGLQSDTYYYYEFEALNKYSQRGRTKTLPIGNVQNLRIAYVSCSNYSFGYFNAYDVIRQNNDIDFVIHLGDYIYEDGFHQDGADTIHRRVYPEFNVYDLASYRMRYSWYRLDPSLRELHRQFPMMVIWDDHEFANDATRDTAFAHDPRYQGTWADRKKAAIEAFKNWIPFREDSTRSNVINRSQSVGSLADIYYLENRIERDDLDNFQQFLNISFGANSPLTYANPNKSMLGVQQRNWLTGELKRSTSNWKIIASQTVLTPYFFKGLLALKQRHPSSWDFYPWDRKHVLDTIARNNIKNLVVLSGDIHVAMAFDIVHDSIPYNPINGSGSMGVEFVCDNVVYGGVFQSMESFMYAANPQLKYMNPTSQGFCVLNITPQKVCCDYWQVDSFRTVDTSKQFLISFCTELNQNHLSGYATPVSTNRVFPPLVGYAPRILIPVGIAQHHGDVELLSYFPNPAQDNILIQYFMQTSDVLKIQISDIQGKTLELFDYGLQEKGLHEEILQLTHLPSGEYILSFQTSSGIVSKKIIKL